MITIQEKTEINRNEQKRSLRSEGNKIFWSANYPSRVDIVAICRYLYWR